MFVFHVDAHTNKLTSDVLINQKIDQVVMTVHRQASVGLAARRAHEKSGHWGIESTIKWAQDSDVHEKGISFS